MFNYDAWLNDYDSTFEEEEIEEENVDEYIDQIRLEELEEQEGE